MNKQILLIVLVALLLTSINFNIYKNSSKELKDSINYFQKFNQKAKEYLFLKQKLSFKATLPRECKITNTKIECKIPKSKLYKISSFLRFSYHIKEFEIKETNSSVIFRGELVK